MCITCESQNYGLSGLEKPVRKIKIKNQLLLQYLYGSLADLLGEYFRRPIKGKHSSVQQRIVSFFFLKSNDSEFYLFKDIKLILLFFHSAVFLCTYETKLFAFIMQVLYLHLLCKFWPKLFLLFFSFSLLISIFFNIGSFSDLNTDNNNNYHLYKCFPQYLLLKPTKYNILGDMEIYALRALLLTTCLKLKFRTTCCALLPHNMLIPLLHLYFVCVLIWSCIITLKITHHQQLLFNLCIKDIECIHLFSLFFLEYIKWCF